MVKPLNKVKKDGSPYFRRESVETLINELVLLSDEELVEKCNSIEKAEYIPSECLVYTIRNAIHQRNDALCNKLLYILLGRCKHILTNKISGGLSGVEQLRQDVLGQFSELFASEYLIKNSEVLDYYEVNFNHAFRCFRITNIRSEIKGIEKKFSESIEIKEETGELYRHCIDHEMADKIKLLSHEKKVLLDQLWCFIRILPEEQKTTLMLLYIDGYTQEAVADMTNVTVRTVRNRKNSGINALKEKLEDKS